MMTGKQYRESLRDGRAVYINGKLVDDLNEAPELAGTINKVAGTYDRFSKEADADSINPLLLPPKGHDELANRLPTLQKTDKVLTSTYLSCMALTTAADRIEEAFPEGAARVRAYVEDCRRRDVRIVQCITDSKGDRSLSASKQSDPDQYLRVIERRPDGVVIRGAKLHITGAPLAHEMMVMPTKRMKPGEEDYAIACGVAVNSPGVRVVAAMPTHKVDGHPGDYPASWGNVFPEGFIIFDDVFVPTERIFLDGQVDQSPAFAHSLGLWERLGASSGQVKRAETIVGLAQLIAEANGTEKISHIKDKINDMVLHATMLRAGLEAAVASSTVSPDGRVTPNELFTNATKVMAATNWAVMVRHLHDIAGGSILTVPSMAAFENPELHDDLMKYMSGANGITGEYRARLFHLIRNMTADAAGGWTAVTTVQAGGGIYAQRMVMRKHFDMDRVKELARDMLGEPVTEAVS